MSDFAYLPQKHFGAILADPPRRFNTWNKTEVVQARASKTTYKSASVHYRTMAIDDIAALPVGDLAAPDCTLFMWICWPRRPDARYREPGGVPFKAFAASLSAKAAA